MNVLALTLVALLGLPVLAVNPDQGAAEKLTDTSSKNASANAETNHT